MTIVSQILGIYVDLYIFVFKEFHPWLNDQGYENMLKKFIYAVTYFAILPILHSVRIYVGY